MASPTARWLSDSGSVGGASATCGGVGATGTWSARKGSARDVPGRDDVRLPPHRLRATPPRLYDGSVTAPTVVILAAGHGTRMRSAVPKMLHPLCGLPLFAWPL